MTAEDNAYVMCIKVFFPYFLVAKGQLISKCLFEKIVWTKIPPKHLIDSALQYFRAESIKCFGGILVQTIFSKRHFEINWPLEVLKNGDRSKNRLLAFFMSGFDTWSLCFFASVSLGISLKMSHDLLLQFYLQISSSFK